MSNDGEFDKDRDADVEGAPPAQSSGPPPGESKHSSPSRTPRPPRPKPETLTPQHFSAVVERARTMRQQMLCQQISKLQLDDTHHSEAVTRALTSRCCASQRTHQTVADRQDAHRQRMACLTYVGHAIVESVQRRMRFSFPSPKAPAAAPPDPALLCRVLERRRESFAHTVERRSEHRRECNTCRIGKQLSKFEQYVDLSKQKESVVLLNKMDHAWRAFQRIITREKWAEKMQYNVEVRQQWRRYPKRMEAIRRLAERQSASRSNSPHSTTPRLPPLSG